MDGLNVYFLSSVEKSNYTMILFDELGKSWPLVDES